MDIAELMATLFNVVLVVFIMATMLSAGFSTTFANLGSVLRRISLVLMVFFVGLVLRPLIGWGAAELFSLETPAYIALVLLAACPGAPLGVKWVMAAKADVVTGAAFQVLLAVVASLTFAPTANLIIETANLGEGVTLPVGDLIKTVAFLQIVPFGVGILTRHWAEVRALEWNEFAKKVSGSTFLAVLVLAILGTWRTIIDLIGSRTLIAGIVFAVVVIVAGYLISTGGRGTKVATAMIQPGSNSGPAFAAVAIAFHNDPLILGATSAIIFMQLVVGTLVAGYVGKDVADEEDGGDQAGQKDRNGERNSHA